MPEGRDIFGPSRVTPELVASAQSKDSVVRWAAILQLGEIGDQAAALAIRHALSDLDDRVYEAACTAARKLEPQIRARVGLRLVKVSDGPPRVEIATPGESVTPRSRRRVPRLLVDQLRPRRGRALYEITVDEFCQVVTMLAERDPGLLRERERAVALLKMIYQVEKAEDRAFSALLEGRWASLNNMFEG